jgi:cell division protein FtsZ
MHEVAEAVSLVEQAAGNEANLIHGVVYKSEPSDEISVTVVATGFNREEKPEEAEKAQFFKPREVELPFKEHIFERSSSFRPPVFGGAGRLEVQSGFSTGRAATEVLSKPKGPNELKQYDAPAYERRLKRETLGILSSTLSQMEHSPGNSDSEEEVREIKQKNDKPAFLRKIMD